MKILFVVNATIMSGGATKSLLSLISQLINAGHEIGLISPDKQGVFEYLNKKGFFTISELYIPNIFNKNVNKFSYYYLRRRIFQNRVNSKASKKLIKKVKEFNPDIIHENTSVTDIGYRLAKKLKKPYIMHFREYGDKDFNWYIPGIKKKIKGKNSYTISITKDIFHHKNQDKNTNSAQIYNGIVLEDSIRYTDQKEKFFLYGGRIEPAKGIFELLTSYYEYQKQCKELKIIPFKLKLAGFFTENDSYYQKCQNFIKENQIEYFIDWLGVRDDLNELMYKCSATVIPSIFEGFGRILPEALANGALCIVRMSGGSKEQLELGQETANGPIGLPFETEKKLTELLFEVTKNYLTCFPFKESHLYYNIIHNGQKYIREHLTVIKNGENTINFYKKILNSNK